MSFESDLANALQKAASDEINLTDATGDSNPQGAPPRRKSALALMCAALIITPAMIADAKSKHGDDKVFIAQLPLDEDAVDFLDVLISVPTRKIIGEFEKYSDKDPNKAKEILINAHCHSFKDTVKSDDGLFYACVNAIADLMPIRKAIIKNC